MLILNYSRLKLKMLVKEVQVYYIKGSVGFAKKKDTQKELASHQSRYIRNVQS